MVKNEKIETWKFEETLPSSLYHLTSKNSSILRLPSNIEVLLHLPSNIFPHPSYIFPLTSSIIHQLVYTRDIFKRD